MPRAEVRPINWPVTVIVFFAGRSAPRKRRYRRGSS